MESRTAELREKALFLAIDEYDESEIVKCNSFYNRFTKRLLGFIIAFLLFILLLPIYIFVSMAILIDSGMPVLYTPLRGGYKEKRFKIYKFRTMVRDADKHGGCTALNDSRITRVGYILRKTKLDEIPQLLNIIKGDMAFIGPRPELLKYTDAYVGKEKYIMQVRPGITDFSSIKFINQDEIVGDDDPVAMFEKYILKPKTLLRIKYAATVSFAVDVKLFTWTIGAVIKKGIKFIFRKSNVDQKTSIPTSQDLQDEKVYVEQYRRIERTES